MKVLVFKHSRVCGWPKHMATKNCTCGEAYDHRATPGVYETWEQAFHEDHDSDAHAVAYTATDEDGKPLALRLAGLFDHNPPGRSEGQVRVQMEYLIFDPDTPGHVEAKDDWWKALVTACPSSTFLYRTPGGGRIVQRLTTPFKIASRADADRWKRSYCAAGEELKKKWGVDCKPDQTKDWTRLFRLPRVIRDF